MSLTSKITLALITMSFVAVGVVGITARVVVLDRFDAFVINRTINGFAREAGEYYRAYGSWENAVANESFHDFNRRTLPSWHLEESEARERRSAGRPAGPPMEAGSSDRAGPPPRRNYELGGAPPPYVATNEDGRVLFSVRDFPTGSQVPAARMENARPIEVDGEVVGYAVPTNRPTLSLMEEEYLGAMEDAWWLSLLMASLIALPMGVLLAKRLTRPLREITDAMAAMKAGRLRQAVKIDSGDEVGALVTSFNEMSSKLADAYDELHDSREELDRQAQQLAEMTRRDDLTGLLNRRGFHELVGKLTAQCRRYRREISLAVLDIDHFKKVNDQFSHSVGDSVLLRAAEILRSTIRETDVVARYGGEEFVIAFPETGIAGATALAERVRCAFESADWDDLVPGRGVTISIGLYNLLPDDSLVGGLDRADERLYAAKDLGRNQVAV